MKIMLKNVRLSFPSLFQKANYNGTETKYEATFLLCKEEHAELITKIRKAMDVLRKEKMKGAKLPDDKRCLKDGDFFEYQGYADHFSLKASNNKRPMVIDRAKQPLTEDDGVIYSGCYVNAQVELWAQNNNYGKRINANLLAVQFYKDGESFGEGGTSANTDDFDSFDDESDF